jgi:hypothetical protein
MKKLLNALMLVACLAAGFALATAWKPLMRWWKGPGFNHSEPTLITGVGDAPAHRGFVLAEAPGDLAGMLEQWEKLWVTAVGIQYTEAWRAGEMRGVVKAAQARKMIVTLLPPPVFSSTNPYPKPLAVIAAEAEEMKADRLCVSWLNVVPDAEYWQKEVTGVREIFTGKIILASTDDIAPAITCWNLTDYMGVTGRITLPRRLPHASDVLTFHDLRLSWESQLTSLESLGRSHGKPLALLGTEVPVAFSMKLPLPGNDEGTPPENPKLQAIAYEALLAETKGRSKDTDMLLLMWSTQGSRDAANGVPGLLRTVGEAWDPKKPRTPETAPEAVIEEEAAGDEGEMIAQ